MRVRGEDPSEWDINVKMWVSHGREPELDKGELWVGVTPSEGDRRVATDEGCPRSVKRGVDIKSHQPTRNPNPRYEKSRF